MKFSCEARVEASMNRQDIIVDKTSRAVEAIEAYIDRAVERGYFYFTNDMSEFLTDFGTEIKEEITGSAEVLETYHISKVGTIAGAIVREGKLKRSNRVRLIRDGIVRYTGELGSLKRFKDDVKEVAQGYDCGLSIAGFNDIKVGDFIEGFEEVEVARTSI